MKTRMYTNIFSWLLVFIFVFFSVWPVRADDYTSTSFILRDPVLTIEGGFSTSTSFQYFSSTGQIETSLGESAAFVERPHFLFFPTATTPVVSATAGNGQVTLSWTAAIGTLGNVTNYRVGIATTSGGPYTFESVGAVLSSVRGGLTNGTTYFFRIQAQAATETVALSVEVSATPVAPAAPSAGGGGGGGVAAPVPPPPPTGATFLGRAFPLRKITILKDGQIAITTIAGPDANFNISLTGLTAGNYLFSVYSEDVAGRHSSLFSFPVTITAGATTTISGLFISPTIEVDKSEVRRGEDIAIFGQSAPSAEITIGVASPDEIFVKAAAHSDGTYLYNFDTTPLTIGHHLTKSKAAIRNEVSSFSASVPFLVGSKTAPKVITLCGKADTNCDGKVNLVDFSIVAFWYKRPISTAFAQIEKERLNGDGKVDLVDFSIMAYHWTG